MRKIATILLLIMAGACKADTILQPVNPLPKGVKASALGFTNTLYVDPCDNLQDKYDWLKSSDRDTVMGGLSDDNWRHLKLTPGKYTQQLNADTDYINIVGTGQTPKDVWLYSEDGVTLNQSCGMLELANLTIEANNPTYWWGFQGWPYYIGLDINSTSDTSKSNYTNCDFVGNFSYHTLYMGAVPIHCSSDSYGGFRNCNFTSQALRLQPNKKLGGSLVDCTFYFQEIGVIPPEGTLGAYCIGGDSVGAEIDNLIIRGCKGGHACIGGCDAYGINVTAYIDDCQFGRNCVALKKKFYGRVRNSLFGSCSCAAGTSGGETGDAFFGGVAENVTIKGRGSEGLDGSYALSGNFVFRPFACGSLIDSNTLGYDANTVIRNCTVETGNTYQSDEGHFPIAFPVIRNQCAFIQTHFSDDDPNANIIIRAKEPGPLYNKTQFYITKNGGSGTTWPADVSQFKIWLRGKLNAPDINATELQAYLELDGDFATYFTCQQLGDGSGMLGFGGTTGYESYPPLTAAAVSYYLGGGSYGPVCENNRSKPVSCVDATVYIWPYYNGVTYHNEYAAVAQNFYLLGAMPGYHYRFEDNNDAAGIDPNIVPEAGDYFVLPDGTEMAAGAGLLNNDDKYNWISVSCTEPNKWQVTYLRPWVNADGCSVTTETDPCYSVNYYATGMNQGVATANDVNFNTIATKHLIGNSGTPIITPGTNLGDGNSVSISGTDAAGLITIITGTTQPTTGIEAVITFNTAYAVAPYVVLFPANYTAASTRTNRTWLTTTTTAFTINGSTALGYPGTTYQWFYHVTQ